MKSDSEIVQLVQSVDSWPRALAVVAVCAAVAVVLWRLIKSIFG